MNSTDRTAPSSGRSTMSDSATPGSAAPAAAGGSACAPTANDSLRHVLIVGGLVSDWDALSADGWSRRVETVGRALHNAGVRWGTLVPYSPDQHGAVAAMERYACHFGAAEVIIEPAADGRERFAAAMRRLSDTEPVNEATVAGVLYEPADSEPDLVVVFGPPTQLPSSLVWELAYAELVFVDADWNALTEPDLADAFEDFSVRRRRFGGLDDEA